MSHPFISKYLQNPRLVILIILLITIMGIFSFLNIPRVLNPSINIAIVSIVTVLPGAGPPDVESLITIPVENAVNGVSNIKKVTSSSLDSLSIVSIEFISGIDADKARTDIQSAVDTLNLPADAQTPKVSKLDFQNQPIWSFTLTSGKDQASLVRFAKALKNRLKQLPEIKDVATTGLDEQEIQIILKPEGIATYNLNPQILLASLKTAVKALPAGAVKTDSNTFTLTIDPLVSQISDIRNLKINLSGSIASLGDVASVFERSKPDQNSSFFASPAQPSQRSINFNVYKTSASQIEDSSKKAQATVSEVLKENKNGFQIYSNTSSADLIAEQFNKLQRDFIITITLVFITLLAFLGLRQAIVSSFAIPLTFFICFTVMKIMNLEFSFIAFFSLLLSLGLLVDDTIVVISAMTAYYKHSQNPLQTGLLVWKDFSVAVLTTTLTTVWAFMPLLLSTGIIGEFIKPIPVVVSSALLGSFFVAMFITLPIMVIILKPSLPLRVRIFSNILFLIAVLWTFYLLVPKTNLLLLQILMLLVLLLIFINIRPAFMAKIIQIVNSMFRNKTGQGFINFEPVTHHYRHLLKKVLVSQSSRRKAVLSVVTFFIFALSLLAFGSVKNEFFPASNQDYLYVFLELPSGTNLAVTEKEAIQILDQLKNTAGLKFANANLGTGFSAMGGYQQTGTNTALISLILTSHTHRSISSVDIAQSIRDKYAGYARGKLTVAEVSSGPPAGADLQLKLFGPDLTVLEAYADRVQNYLSKQADITDIDKSIKPSTGKITFVPDQTKISQSNLTLDQIGFWLRIFASGFKAESLKLPGETEDKDISIRVDPNSLYVQNISKLVIPTPLGNVPIASLGTLKLKANPTLITREAGKRTISVTAGVKKGFNIQDQNKELEKFANALNLPTDYSWQTGGVNEENQRSVNSILQAMLLSFLLIVVTMVIQFNSFRDAIIVMLVIPLAVSGVFILFALTHTPLSFPALVGILALFGIVVKNSILLVDKINKNKKRMDLSSAIINAAASRMEPIFLTSFATIIGLIPITLSNALWRGLGGAIIAGLLFSGTVMLIFIPVVYYLLFAGNKKSK